MVSKAIACLCLSIVLTAAAQNALASAVHGSCIELFTPEADRRAELLRLNKNAAQEVARYSAINYRSLGSYFESFGELFRRRFSKTKTWLDVGSGYGIAGLQAAKKGKKVLLINAQDTWEPLLKLEGGPASSEGRWSLSGDGSTHVYTKGDVQIASYNGRPRAIRVAGAKAAIWDWLIELAGYYKFHSKWKSAGDGNYEESADRYQELAAEILRPIKKLFQKGLVSFRSGFAENVLPTVRQKFGLLTDLYGAYFYSATRVELLENYYKSLAEDGEAFIGIQQEHINDVVELKSGAKKQFWVYLVERYPTVFRVYKSENTTVLLMRRDPHLNELSIPVTYSSEDVSVRRYDSENHSDYVIPSIRMREI